LNFWCIIIQQYSPVLYDLLYYVAKKITIKLVKLFCHIDICKINWLINKNICT